MAVENTQAYYDMATITVKKFNVYFGLSPFLFEKLT
jgi:hypothetical protein